MSFRISNSSAKYARCNQTFIYVSICDLKTLFTDGAYNDYNI